jgi:hypothetical protein
MKFEIIRLDSVIENGVGGPGAGAINLIYSHLLLKSNLTFYTYIHINQIGSDLDELLIKEGKKVYINIRYPSPEKWEFESTKERNEIRLEVVHTAMLRLASQDERIQATILEDIKHEILKNDFSYYIVYKSFINKKDENLVAKIIIHPEEKKFDFYVSIENKGTQESKRLIYSGKTTEYYFDALFSSGKWKNFNEFTITGKSKELEIRISLEDGKVDFINLTNYDKPPFFEMMKIDLPKEEKEAAYNNWIHSLPPAVAAFMNKPN